MDLSIPQELIEKIQQQNQQQAAELLRQQQLLAEQASQAGATDEPSV